VEDEEYDNRPRNDLRYRGTRESCAWPFREEEEDQRKKEYRYKTYTASRKAD